VESIGRARLGTAEFGGRGVALLGSERMAKNGSAGEDRAAGRSSGCGAWFGVAMQERHCGAGRCVDGAELQASHGRAWNGKDRLGAADVVRPCLAGSRKAKLGGAWSARQARRSRMRGMEESRNCRQGGEGFGAADARNLSARLGRFGPA